ncbi:MAG: DNA-binding response regulator [Promicromonosporaceae bacterium]|nr:DNA-binding response regulator [Promicromonosporaceae bacterium]
MPSRTRTDESVVVVQGPNELFRRISPLFTQATDIACAAGALATWRLGCLTDEIGDDGVEHAPGARVRKIYRAGVLLDPVAAQALRRRRDRLGAQIRVTADEINETMIFDDRVAVLMGDVVAGQRTYTILTTPQAVQGVASLFEAAWRSASDLDVFDAGIAEIRELAPRVLDLLSEGAKDEAAARTLGLGVRTYRRRVAELMDALGATSRFQAGVRARELGLV